MTAYFTDPMSGEFKKALEEAFKQLDFEDEKQSEVKRQENDGISRNERLEKPRAKSPLKGRRKKTRTRSSSRARK